MPTRGGIRLFAGRKRSSAAASESTLKPAPVSVPPNEEQVERPSTSQSVQSTFSAGMSLPRTAGFDAFDDDFGMSTKAVKRVPPDTGAKMALQAPPEQSERRASSAAMATSQTDSADLNEKWRKRCESTPSGSSHNKVGTGNVGRKVSFKDHMAATKEAPSTRPETTTNPIGDRPAAKEAVHLTPAVAKLTGGKTTETMTADFQAAKSPSFRQPQAMECEDVSYGSLSSEKWETTVNREPGGIVDTLVFTDPKSSVIGHNRSPFVREGRAGQLQNDSMHTPVMTRTNVTEVIVTPESLPQPGFKNAGRKSDDRDKLFKERSLTGTAQGPANNATSLPNLQGNTDSFSEEEFEKSLSKFLTDLRDGLDILGKGDSEILTMEVELTHVYATTLRERGELWAILDELDAIELEADSVIKQYSTKS